MLCCACYTMKCLGGVSGQPSDWLQRNCMQRNWLHNESHRVVHFLVSFLLFGCLKNVVRLLRKSTLFFLISLTYISTGMINDISMLQYRRNSDPRYSTRHLDISWDLITLLSRWLQLLEWQESLNNFLWESTCAKIISLTAVVHQIKFSGYQFSRDWSIRT